MKLLAFDGTETGHCLYENIGALTQVDKVGLMHWLASKCSNSPLLNLFYRNEKPNQHVREHVW